MIISINFIQIRWNFNISVIFESFSGHLAIISIKFDDIMQILISKWNYFNITVNFESFSGHFCDHFNQIWWHFANFNSKLNKSQHSCPIGVIFATVNCIKSNWIQLSQCNEMSSDVALLPKWNSSSWSIHHLKNSCPLPHLLLQFKMIVINREIVKSCNKLGRVCSSPPTWNWWNWWNLVLFFKYSKNLSSEYPNDIFVIWKIVKIVVNLCQREEW